VINIVIADDQALVRSGIRMILNDELDMTVVGEASSGREAVAVARRTSPTVVIMDVRMPDGDGILATRQLTSAGPLPRVLILTTFDVEDAVFQALCAGASGFLLKDAPEDRLISAIRMVADGSSVFAPTATRQVVEAFAQKGSPIGVGGQELLTEREVDVVRELSRGCSNIEIAQALYLTENTVKSHVAHILLKLGLRDRVQIVVWAYQRRIAA
jgi:DNA-binding NarL/FixJ family response regulator